MARTLGLASKVKHPAFKPNRMRVNAPDFIKYKMLEKEQDFKAVRIVPPKFGRRGDFGSIEILLNE